MSIHTATRTRNGLPEFRAYQHGASNPLLRPVIDDDYPACLCGAPLPDDRIKLCLDQCETCAPGAPTLPPRSQAGQVHYLASELTGTACQRSTVPLLATTDPAHVTCSLCKRTRAYRAAGIWPGIITRPDGTYALTFDPDLRTS